MKILHVITTVADSGGAEKLMEELLPGLKREGLDISCLVFNGFDSKNRKTLENSGIKVYELSHNTQYYNPVKIIKLIPFVRKFNVIHTHNTPAVILTAIANLFGSATLVTTVHNTDFKLRHFWLGRIFDKWVHKRYNTIICCSKKAEESLLKVYPVFKSNTITINNGVNLTRFIEAIPNEPIKGFNGKSIVMVAWFRKQKDHKTAISSLQHLPTSFHLFLVGDGDTKEECIRFSIELKLEDRVHFLGLRTDVPAILKSSDYIVLASHYEGLSLSSVEGMAAGKPFIASDVSGLREVVSGAGVLFPEGNAKELAAAIIRLDSNSALYREVSDRCVQRAMQYDIVNMINGYKSVYQQIDN